MSLHELSRRHFITTASASAAALGLTEALGPAASASRLFNDPRLRILAQVPGAHGLELRFSAAAVQDRFAGAPLDQAFYETQAVAYRAGEGQPGLLYIPPADQSRSPGNQVVALTRNDASPTGWTKTVRELDSGDAFEQRAWITPYVLVRGGKDPKVFAYGTTGLHAASLKGGFGQFALVHRWDEELIWQGQPRYPLETTHGRLPDDAHYLLETNGHGSVNLRDIDSYQEIQLGAGAADMGGLLTQPLTILSGSPKGIFRCVISNQRNISFMTAMDEGYGGKLFNVTFEHIASWGGGNDILRSAVAIESGGWIGIAYTMDRQARAENGATSTDSRLYFRHGTYLPNSSGLPLLSEPAAYDVSFPDKKQRVFEVSCAAINAHDGGFDIVLHAGGALLSNGERDQLYLCTVKPNAANAVAIPLADGVASVFTPSTQLEFIRSDVASLGGNILGIVPQDVWTIRNFSQFDVKQITVPNPGAVKTQVVMRVGVSVYNNGLPVCGSPVDVLADTSTWATVGGKERLLNETRPVRGVTDFSGRLTIAMPVGTNLYVPDLIVKGENFAAKCHPSDYILHRALTLSATDLLKHSSDASNPDNQSSAASAAVALGNLRSTLPAVMPGRAQARGAAYRVLTDGSIGAEAYDGPMSFPEAKAADPSVVPNFTLDLQGGKLVASSSAVPVVIEADILDWLKDRANDVKDLATSGFRWASDEAVQLEHLAVKGATVLLGAVIDGAAFLFSGPLKGLTDLLGVTSAIFWLLDKAGFIIGRLDRWLLSGLIDWDKLGRTRDSVKSNMRQAFSTAMSRVDPLASMRSYASDLDSVRTAIDGALTKLQKNPSSARAQSSIPSMPSFLSVVLGNEDFRAVIEKLVDAISDFIPMPAGFSASGFSEAGESFLGDVVRLADAAAFSLDDFAQAVSSLIADGELFSAPLDPLLAILQRHIDAGLKASGGVLVDSGTLLSIGAKNASAVFDWLDTEIELPFLSGYYNGITEGKLTPLDLVALGAASIMTIGETIVHDITKRILSYEHCPAAFCTEAAPGTAVFVSESYYTIDKELAVALPNIENDWTFALGIVSAVTGTLIVGLDCEYTAGSFSSAQRLLLQLDAAANFGYLSAAIATAAGSSGVEDLAFVVLWLVGVTQAVNYLNLPQYRRSPVGAITSIITIFGLLKVLFAQTFSSALSARQDAEMWGTGSILILEQVLGAFIRYYVQKSQKSLPGTLTAAAMGTKLGLAVTRNVVNRFG